MSAATCPCDDASPTLPPVGEAIVELMNTLSEAERCAVLRRFFGDTGADATASQADETVSDDESNPFVTTIFPMFLLLVLGCVGYLVWNERLRYLKRNADEQGSFGQYLKYRFAYWYAWTPGSSWMVLLSLSFFLFVTSAFLMRVIAQAPVSDSFWSAWIWIAAPDGGGSGETASSRAIGLMTSVGGMLIFALLMSVISSVFEEALQGLRAGRIPVIEGNHIVIIGWASPILKVIAEELCNANESEGGTLITILSPRPKVEVEEFLQEVDVTEWRRNSLIVVRSGDSHKTEDLQKVAIQSAKKILILSKPDVAREEADVITLNALLALRQNGWPRNGACIVQCQLVRNQQLFARLCNPSSRVLTTFDFVSQLFVQCSRQQGLTSVVRSIFSFDGDEFYFSSVGGIEGLSFMEVLFALPGVIVAGVVTSSGKIELVPSMQRRFERDEQLVVLAEDDSEVPERISTSKLQDIMDANMMQRHHIPCKMTNVQSNQLIIIIGWNEMLGAMMEEVDKTVGPCSKVIIHSPVAVADRLKYLEDAQRRRSYRYQNCEIEHTQGLLGARFKLDELPLEQANNIVVLGDSMALSASHADTQTLAVVVQVQDILTLRCGANGETWPSIMPQLLEADSEEGVKQAGVVDYMMTNRLAARVMAGVCEVPQLCSIIDCLVKERSCTFRIRELSEYQAAKSFVLEEGVSFDEVAVAAALANEVALGWSAVGGSEVGPWEMNPKNRRQKRKWPLNARIVAFKQVDKVATAKVVLGARPASLALPGESRHVRARIGQGE